MWGSTPLTTPPADFDSPWKEALEEYLEDFFALFFPEIHAEIDWARRPVFLDKELQQVVREAELGRRVADKLIRVWRRDGTDAWVLVHIEILLANVARGRRANESYVDLRNGYATFGETSVTSLAYCLAEARNPRSGEAISALVVASRLRGRFPSPLRSC